MRGFLFRLMTSRALRALGVAAFGVAAFWAGSAIAQAAAGGDPATAVQCANGGKLAIVAVYTSPPGRSDWSDDMLGKGTLKPGQTRMLKLKAKPDGCKVDFSALLVNGDSVTKKDIDLCAPSPTVGF
jgi:hypothetical protein